jgi:tetratricopeptide (TPR) repeat protein
MENRGSRCAVQVAQGIFRNGVSSAPRRKLLNHVVRVARLFAREFVICAFVVLALAKSLPAQDSSGGGSPGWPLHDSAPTHGSADAIGTPPPSAMVERDESCLIWTAGDLRTAPTVKAGELKIPEKAKGEFRKACGDYRGKRFATAEGHARKAVEVYPQYAAAWVLLGQTLEAASRTEDARGACSQASTVDAQYAAAYLCLADVAGQLHDWQQALESADRALAIDPLQDVYGNFYSAMAHFHLGHLPVAERNAQQAIDADHFHRVPQTHLLLAQIYGAKHDLHGEAAQLRAFLKIAPNSPYAPGVRKSLAEVEGQIEK